MLEKDSNQKFQRFPILFLVWLSLVAVVVYVLVMLSPGLFWIHLLAMANDQKSSSSLEANSIYCRLHGAWDLISWYAEKDGVKRFPFGEDAIGRLLYMPSGYVSAHLAKAQRSPVSNTNYLELNEAESAIAYKEALAYTGTFDVDPVARTVRHHIYTSMDPSAAGTHLTRDFEFSNDDQTLILSLTFFDQSKMILEWRRMEDYQHDTTPHTDRQMG